MALSHLLCASRICATLRRMEAEMDLRLDVVRTRGRAPKKLEVDVVRALREADLELLEEEKGARAPGLVKRLSNRHHLLARLLAEGMSPGDAGLTAGYVPSRVSILQADPSFAELVRFYKGQRDEAFASMHEKILGLSEDALEELRERLEDEPESFTNGMLIDLMAKAADRAGHGPSATQVNVNVNLADRLAAARERAERAKVVEHNPLRLEDDG